MRLQGKTIGYFVAQEVEDLEFWVPISAGILQGKKATGSKGIKDDITNAGGIWVDTPAFREGTMVWGRVVEDIPDFCRELIAALAE
jgi:protease I